MKKILLLGAGMVAKPITDYLLDNGFELTIASRTISKAEKLINRRPNGKAVEWTIDKPNMLDQMVADHDLTVSLLPYISCCRCKSMYKTSKKYGYDLLR